MCSKFEIIKGKRYFCIQVFTDKESLERAREKIKSFFREQNNGDAGTQPEEDCVAKPSVSNIVVILIEFFFYTIIISNKN